MSLRTRLGFQILESRDNPSDFLGIGDLGGEFPDPVESVDPVVGDPNVPPPPYGDPLPPPPPPPPPPLW
jgi:hypothetical protein